MNELSSLPALTTEDQSRGYVPVLLLKGRRTSLTEGYSKF